MEIKRDLRMNFAFVHIACALQIVQKSNGEDKTRTAGKCIRRGRMEEEEEDKWRSTGAEGSQSRRINIPMEKVVSVVNMTGY